jgi:LysM repeat protein
MTTHRALPRAHSRESTAVPLRALAARRRRNDAALGALALGLLGLAALSLHRPAAAAGFPVTSEQREIADKTATSGVLLSELAPNAPASYTIKRGDTLWSIATLYLKTPWRWPELWGMNRTQIQNPHLIYPGQTLGLVKTADGRAQLVLGGAANATPAPAPVAAAPAPEPVAAVPTVRLSPRAREVGMNGESAISSIPNNLIEPYLSRPAVVAAHDLDQYPRVVATQQDRVNLGLGDAAYARGITDPRIENYNVLRPARALFEPEDTRHEHPIAYESVFLGTARVIKYGEVSTLTITNSKLEIGVGDRLAPVSHQELVTYAPHRLDKDVSGNIISVYGGLDSVGAGDIVTLDRGRKDGLEIGHVVAVLHNGHSLIDNTQYAGEAVQLPDEYVGTAFVFRVFDSISYALLTSASGPIKVSDRIGPPEGAAPARPATAMNTP